MSSTSPQKPNAGDYVMWAVVGFMMLTCLLGLVSMSDSPLAWALYAPLIVVGAWLMWRRWRFVRDGVPHI